MVKWNGKTKAAGFTPHHAGLTLIGVLVAILVFSAILIAVTQLLGRSQKNVGISREEFIATNLAREGLELVQYVRDTNWLAAPAGRSWTDNATPGAPPLCRDDTDHTFTIDRSGVIGAILREGSSPQLWLLDGQYYTHDPNRAISSPFSRVIVITCGERNAVNDEHIAVTSRVTWNSRGQNHEVTLTTKLYNWYQ